MPLRVPKTRAAWIAPAAIAALVLSGLAACGSGDGSDEESLTLYSGRNEALVQPLLDSFTEETGIEVSVRYGGSAEMAAQLLEEGDRSPADAFLAQDAGALGALAAEGMLAPLPQETLDLVPAAYRSADDTWIGLTGRSRVLVYNENSVSAEELPETVFELTEEQWSGRVGIAPANASFQAFVTAIRLIHGDDTAREWLADLAANDPHLRERNGMIVTDVDDGVFDVGLVNHYYLFEKAEEDGVAPEDLDVDQHFFTDGDAGALVNISGIGALGAEPSPAAQELITYLLSTTGQEYFRDETHEYPMVEGIEADESLPPLAGLDQPEIDLNDLDDLQTTVEMISEAGLS